VSCAIASPKRVVGDQLLGKADCEGNTIPKVGRLELTTGFRRRTAKNDAIRLSCIKRFQSTQSMKVTARLAGMSKSASVLILNIGFTPVPAFRRAGRVFAGRVERNTLLL
jgi:hypothetical protein